MKLWLIVLVWTTVRKKDGIVGNGLIGRLTTTTKSALYFFLFAHVQSRLRCCLLLQRLLRTGITTYQCDVHFSCFPEPREILARLMEIGISKIEVQYSECSYLAPARVGNTRTTQASNWSTQDYAEMKLRWLANNILALLLLLPDVVLEVCCSNRGGVFRWQSFCGAVHDCWPEPCAASTATLVATS